MLKKLWTAKTIRRLPYGPSDNAPTIALHDNYEQIRDSIYDIHYCLEPGIVIAGRMRRYYQDFQTDLNPGNIWFCGMWEPQLLKESAKDSLKRVWKRHWVGVAPEENTNESLMVMARPSDVAELRYKMLYGKSQIMYFRRQ